MKKYIILIFLFLSCMIVIAGNDSPGNKEVENIVSSARIAPRYFNDKIIIGNISTNKIENANIHIYSETGVQLISEVFSVDEEFVYYTNKLEKGNYVYYIVVQNRPIVKGSFSKE